MSKYRLRDDGIPTLRRILQGSQAVGWATANGDGTFTGRIRDVQVAGCNSWRDALNQVVAKISGCSVADLGSSIIEQKKVQKQTKLALDWLRNKAKSNDGHLQFCNAELANAIGWRQPSQRRPLGNLMSRLDACCCWAKLPAIGCAADKVFADAWGPNRRHDWKFKWPVELMQQGAKGRRWTDADFDAIQRESLALHTGSGPHAWDELYAKHSAAVEQWAFSQ